MLPLLFLHQHLISSNTHSRHQEIHPCMICLDNDLICMIMLGPCRDMVRCVIPDISPSLRVTHNMLLDLLLRVYIISSVAIPISASPIYLDYTVVNAYEDIAVGQRQYLVVAGRGRYARLRQALRDDELLVQGHTEQCLGSRDGETVGLEIRAVDAHGEGVFAHCLGFIVGRRVAIPAGLNIVDRRCAVGVEVMLSR